jgi:hypothetical protein
MRLTFHADYMHLIGGHVLPPDIDEDGLNPSYLTQEKKALPDFGWPPPSPFRFCRKLYSVVKVQRDAFVVYYQDVSASRA